MLKARRRSEILVSLALNCRDPRSTSTLVFPPFFGLLVEGTCGAASSLRVRRMSSAAPMRVPLTTLDDDAWDDLLSFIEERRVIPIVGPELLQVSTERGPRLLYDWLADKLAVRLNVDVAALPQPYTLNDVVCWFLARARREEAYVRVRSILKDANFEPPRGAAASGGDHGLRPVRLDDLRSASRDRDQPAALRRGAVDGGALLLAQPRRRSAVRARSVAAAGRLSPVRAGLRLADLRDLR